MKRELEMGAEDFLEYAGKERSLFIGEPWNLRKALVDAQEFIANQQVPYFTELVITVTEEVHWYQNGDYGEEGELIAWDLEDWD